MDIWFLLILVVGLLAIMFMGKNRGKKEEEARKTLVESIKVGHDVLTSSGVLGKVVSIVDKDNMKIITLQTGNDANSGYVAFDVNAIYSNLTANEELAKKLEAEAVKRQAEEKLAAEQRLAEENKEREQRLAKKLSKQNKAKKEADVVEPAKEVEQEIVVEEENK